MDTNKLIIYGPTGQLAVSADQWDFIQMLPGLSADRYKAAKEAANGTATPKPIETTPVVDKPVETTPTPTGGALTVLLDNYNPTTRALTLKTEGGTGSTVSFEIPGVTSGTTKKTVTIDEGPARERKEVYEIRATQDGKRAPSVWFSLATYTLVPNPKGTTTPTESNKPVDTTKPTGTTRPPITEQPTTQPVDVNANDETNETNNDNGVFFQTNENN